MLASFFRRQFHGFSCALSSSSGVHFTVGRFLAATADILPQVHRIEERNPMTLLLLLGGLAVSWSGKLLEQ
jgi:hypothetical protein